MYAPTGQYFLVRLSSDVSDNMSFVNKPDYNGYLIAEYFYLIHVEELCKPLKRVKRKVKRIQLNTNIKSCNTDYAE